MTKKQVTALLVALVILGAAFVVFLPPSYSLAFVFAIASLGTSLSVNNRKTGVIISSVFTSGMIAADAYNSSKTPLVVYHLAIIAATWIAYLLLDSISYKSKKEKGFERKLLAELFDNSPHAIILLDFYTRKVFDCNTKTVQMFDAISKEEIVGSSRDEFIINVLSESELTECRKSISLEGSWSKTLRHTTKKGRVFWAEITISPIQVEKKNLYVMRINDITPRVQAKSDKDHALSRMNTLLNNINSVVYSTHINSDGTYELELVSERIKDLFGLPVEQYKNTYKAGKILEFIHQDDHEKVRDAVRRLKEDKKTVELVYRFKNPEENKYVWIEETVIPQFNLNGTHIGNFGVATDVTPRIEYEKALKDSEERYRTLFERNLAGVYKARVEDKVIVDCNSSFAKILGYNSKEDVIGKVSSHLYTETSDEGRFHDNILKEKSILNHESRLQLRDGREIWILENARVVDEYGEPSYVEGTLIDVTPLKEAQEALKRSEENLSLVINNLDDIIYNIQVDDNGESHFKYVSPQIEEVLGLSISEYEKLIEEKEGVTKMIHPDDKEKVIAMTKIIRDNKRPVSLVYRIKNQKTGNYHWLEENVYPKVEDDRIVAKLGIVRDITQRKFAEEALRISEKRYRGLFERNLAGVFRIEEEGKIVECNDSFAHILGYSESKELLASNAHELYFDKGDREEFVAQLIKEGSVSNYEIRLKRKDNSEVWCLVNAVFNQDWGLIEGTLIDITELRVTGEALIESERMLSTLFSNLPGMAYRCKFEEDWPMEFVSEGFYELTEYKPEQIVNNKEISFNEIIIPEFLSIFKSSTELLEAGETNFFYEYQIKTKSGEVKWVWERGEMVLDEQGTPIAFEGFISDITDRKQYEQELDKRREEYQRLVDESPYGIVIHKKGHIKYANSKAFEILGITKPDAGKKQFKSYQEVSKKLSLEKKTIYDFIHPDFVDDALNRKKKLESGEELPFIEVKLRRLDGKEIDVETRSVLTVHEGEEAIEVVFNDITAKKQLVREQARAQAAEELNAVLEREITEHKITQEKLKENQRFTRYLIESSLDMIVAVNNDDEITEVNQSALEKFGYTAEELLGKSPSVLYANEKTYKEVRSNLNEVGTYVGEIENIDKSGITFSSIISASQILDNEGNIIGAMGISRDISEIKDVEKIISQQSSTLKSIFEGNSNMLIWIVDRDFRYNSFNKSFYNACKLLLGREPKTNGSLADDWSNSISKEEFSGFLTHFKRALQGTNQQFEVKLIDVRNNEFWLEIYLSPIVLPDGNIKEIACLAHEITDKKYAEIKIKESLKEKEILLKEVHHRVKNNLQVISSILNLQSSYVEDENTLNILRESQNRIKSMSFIHESLYQTKNFSSINFSEYIINLTKNLVHSYQITSGNIEFNYNVDEIHLDLDQAIPCGLIVNELVSNSLKYAFPEGREGELKLELHENNGTIQLGVSDNGVGLPDDLDIEDTNTLGLQLVLTLIEQLDGKLELKREKGTKYFITFDRQKPQ